MSCVVSTTHAVDLWKCICVPVAVMLTWLINLFSLCMTLKNLSMDINFFVCFPVSYSTNDFTCVFDITLTHGCINQTLMHNTELWTRICFFVALCSLFNLNKYIICLIKKNKLYLLLMHGIHSSFLYTLFILSCSSFGPLKLMEWTSLSVRPMEVSGISGRRQHTTCFTLWRCISSPCLSWPSATPASSPRSMDRC